ncbi:MAG: penicillin-binding protein activator [Myxococcales bacterium]|nr:penicillin-binding protein activator [Myxococcales bacterium]
MGAQCASAPPKLEHLPEATTAEPEVQRDFDRASEAENQHDTARAIALYQTFLARHPDDSMAPLARFRLGRALLSRGEVEKADQEFLKLGSAKASAIRVRGELYHGVVLAAHGQADAALLVLTPYIGRVPEPEDESWLERAALHAAKTSHNVTLALRALGALEQHGNIVTARTIQETVRQRVAGVKNNELLEAYHTLPRDTDTWRQVAARIAPEGSMQQSKIGVLLPLSGRAKLIGQSALRAMQLAAAEESLNLQERLMVLDTAGEPQRAVTALSALLEEPRMIAVIGPVTYDVTRAISAPAQDAGLPVLTLGNASATTQLGSTLLRLMPSPESEVSALIRRATERGARRFAVLYPDSQYGQSMRQRFAKALEAASGALIFEEAYRVGTTDFKDIAQSLRRSSADAVFVPDTSKTLALIAPTLAAVGLWSTLPGSKAVRGRPMLLLIPHAGFDVSLGTTVSRYLQGAVFSVPFDANLSHPDTQKFVAMYRDQFGEAPDIFAAYAYDAYRLLALAIKEGVSSRDAMLAFLVSGHASVGTASAAGGVGANRGPLRETQLVELSGSTFVLIPESRGRDASP